MRLSLLLAVVFQMSALAAMPQAEAERIADAKYLNFVSLTNIINSP